MSVINCVLPKNLRPLPVIGTGPKNRCCEPTLYTIKGFWDWPKKGLWAEDFWKIRFFRKFSILAEFRPDFAIFQKFQNSEKWPLSDQIGWNLFCAQLGSKSVCGSICEKFGLILKNWKFWNSWKISIFCKEISQRWKPRQNHVEMVKRRRTDDWVVDWVVTVLHHTHTHIQHIQHSIWNKSTSKKLKHKKRSREREREKRNFRSNSIPMREDANT